MLIYPFRKENILEMIIIFNILDTTGFKMDKSSASADYKIKSTRIK